MLTYNSVQDLINHLGEFREQLITKAKLGKSIHFPQPNWWQAETICYNTLPYDIASTVARHFDHAQDYLKQEEFGAAAYHIMLAIGKIAS